MSKAAELQRRFGQNLSESLGVRTNAAAEAPSRSPGRSLRETSPDDGRTRAREAGFMEIERIVPDPDQPRKEFDPDSVDRLAASLLKHGQLMPIRVRWNAKLGKWVVISGERRYRAALQAGLETICCLFNDGEPTPSEILQEQLIENCLREDLKPIEQARAYRQLMEMHGWTAKQLSEELHISKSEVSKALALLTLPEDLQERVDEGAIQASAAYEVARIKDESAQREVARRIVAERLTRDEAVTAARAAAVSVAPEPAKGRGGAAKEPLKRHPVATAFRVAGARVAVEFTRKSIQEEDVLAALEAAADQVRTSIAARDANAS
jgi:ParB family transcriptional regulator, chromosome partitioning protein